MGCGGVNKTTHIATSFRAALEASQADGDIKILPSTFVKANENRFVQVYKLGAALGAGISGDVRKCVHRDSKEERAVKIFRRNTLNEVTIHGTTRSREVEILRIIDHPNIVRVYEYFEDAKRIFLVMEYCKGGQLQHYVHSKHQFSEQVVASLVKQVFEVLSYLHDKGIVHRDMKPDNIVLEENDGSRMNIKIIDFGAATYITRKTPLKGAVGTIGYSAPEVYKGTYNEKIDVWSGGVIMYILLCGKPPFEGTTDQQVIERTCSMRINVSGGVWNSISREAVELLQAIFAPAEDRISAKEVLQHPWIHKFCQANLREGALADTLANIKSFHYNTKFKDAVLTYIATQRLTAQDTRELRDVFKQIDVNGDGKISKEELFDQYRKQMDEGEARELVDMVMREVDSDGSGFMDYTEFLKASIDQKKLLSHKNLEKAFSMFDRDGSGTISTSEIRKVLASGSKVDESIWAHILSEVDENGDGEIDVKEFEALLEARL